MILFFKFISLIFLIPVCSFSSTDIERVDRETLHRAFKLPPAKLPLDKIQILPQDQMKPVIAKYIASYLDEVQNNYISQVKTSIPLLNSFENRKKIQLITEELLKNEPITIDSTLNDQITLIGKQAVDVIYETNSNPTQALINDMAAEVINMKAQIEQLKKNVTRSESEENVDNSMLLYTLLGLSSLSVCLSLFLDSGKKSTVKKKT